jgi:hypothetical protein
MKFLVIEKSAPKTYRQTSVKKDFPFSNLKIIKNIVKLFLLIRTQIIVLK